MLSMPEEIREAIEAGEYKAYKKRKLEGMMQYPDKLLKIMFISSYFSILKNILEVWKKVVYSSLIALGKLGGNYNHG